MYERNKKRHLEFWDFPDYEHSQAWIASQDDSPRSLYAFCLPYLTVDQNVQIGFNRRPEDERVPNKKTWSQQSGQCPNSWPSLRPKLDTTFNPWQYPGFHGMYSGDTLLAKLSRYGKSSPCAVLYVWMIFPPYIYIIFIYAHRKRSFSLSIPCFLFISFNCHCPRDPSVASQVALPQGVSFDAEQQRYTVQTGDWHHTWMGGISMTT